MSNVGITGHQRIRGAAAHDPSEASKSDWGWVRSELERVLAMQPSPLIGHSSLAAGADQLFAEIVLKCGGKLHVVRPFPTYRSRIEREQDRLLYDILLAKAQKVDDVKGTFRSDDEAYLLAGKQVVERSELMLAVWEGKEQSNIASTSQIVHFAKQRGCPLIILDPIARSVAHAP